MSEVLALPTRFRDALQRPDTRGREVETAMAMHLEPFVLRNRLGTADIMRGLMGNIVAIIFAKASSLDDAREGAEYVCAEIMRRVTDH